MNSPSLYSWWKLKIFFPPEIEESLIWKLGQIGINKFAIKFKPELPEKRCLFIWLVANEWSKPERIALEESLYSLVNPFNLKFNFEPCWELIDDEDWALTWKNHWQPDPVGNQLLVLPAWIDLPDEFSQRLVIRMDPGSAFGTGSHPSTRLCLEELERHPPKNQTIADLGCGSGILTFAALGLGAKKAFAVDTDSLAIRASKDNSLLNGIDSSRLRLVLGSVEALHEELEAQKIDFLVCNILAAVISDLAPSFNELIAPQGEALLSGLLVDQASELIHLLKKLGWSLISLAEKERWAMLRVRKCKR